MGWTLVNSAPLNASKEALLKAQVNLIYNPEIISSCIMRATIIQDDETDDATPYGRARRIIVRTLVPRNPLIDEPLDQKCYILEDAVVYEPQPHGKIPFYHPNVRAMMITYTDDLKVYYDLFDDVPLDNRLERIALRYLTTISKHARGIENGYKKRVHHDQVVDKVAFQTKYLDLKLKHAKFLIDNWVESTDPAKHVFEDLSIAAFLIELWKLQDVRPTSFVDLGCGNGVLVYILTAEGYQGHGIEARRRKTWSIFPAKVQERLIQQLFVPRATQTDYTDCSRDFDEGTFVIGNHPDELTLWIPLLKCPFVVIPCCSHALSGERKRFKPKSQERKSTFASLVDHTIDIATAAGWTVQTEMLRVPSTRNTAIIGLSGSFKAENILQIINNEGGHSGWLDHANSLTSTKGSGH
ncbi:hypothetical protein CANCADRAFT_98130 [Tortispora caseinolytica NRRL Y-17796]|uniref:tRNA (uracil-O(2)-)-methyltransferase n=1 Tax=Tortispora caseinolytica NRRL Y-17796 TaxID=767744 RepID=A0A1E4TDT4_9ASCO|nr:hypothetical protein CANCADRAFT_98130 [Tortispora caseinolytica NRRL Y-17796]